MTHKFSLDLTGKTCRVSFNIEVDGEFDRTKNMFDSIDELISNFIKEGDNKFVSVTLTSVEPVNKIPTIKVIRDYMGLGIREAKDIVESVMPVVLGEFERPKAVAFMEALNLVAKAQVGHARLQIMK